MANHAEKNREELEATQKRKQNLESQRWMNMMIFAWLYDHQKKQPKRHAPRQQDKNIDKGYYAQPLISLCGVALAIVFIKIAEQCEGLTAIFVAILGLVCIIGSLFIGLKVRNRINEEQKQAENERKAAEGKRDSPPLA